ncbi:NUDIX domain-containing protein [Promicromonospora sukumoe]|uniref:NUDIX domain-containing protein n=1 Tax=Promicromonospora sukumoe TaxID=88382 RepID=UPI002483E1FC|nr:NUDIX domain-containing protein [Promicromonospora sukumoe]
MLGAGRELTVRALVRSQGFVLVVRETATGRMTLPGGRVGEGRSVQGSLQEHVAHQTGLQVTVTGFAGALHHTAHPGPVGNVITLVFEAEGSDPDPTSTETFDRAEIHHPQWLALEDLAEYDMAPVALRDALLERADGPFWRAWTR